MNHHITDLKVRTYECDSNRHVNNAVYLQYLEYARMEFLCDHGFAYDTMKDDGYSIIVTEIHIRYLASAKRGDELKIISRPVKKRISSGTVHQRITGADGRGICEAEVKWAFVNSKGRPVRIPDKYHLEALTPQ